MKTSRDVYNQICWDPFFNEYEFWIGYRESKKISEVRVPEFDHQTIPWNRVHYFKWHQDKVWDRHEKIDMFSQGIIRNYIAKRQKSPPSSPTDTTAEITPHAAYSFQQGSWKPAVRTGPPVKISSLSLFTLNVLFDIYAKEDIYTKPRRKYILSFLQKHQPDIIVLEEMTLDFWWDFLEKRWIRNNYYVSENEDGRFVEPYGQVVLSRYPIKSIRYHRFSRDKTATLAEWQFGESSLFLAAVHLTSSRAKNSLPKRREQLQQLLSYMPEDKYDLCIIAGDFNFETVAEDQTLTSVGFSDVWRQIHPQHPGYTFDPRYNHVAEITSVSGKPARYDRIFYRAYPEIYPEKIELTLNFPIDTTEHIFTSDHYALQTQFRFTSRPTYHSALAIVPPKEMWQPIQKIRQQHDRSFERWMPHINLLYGFIPEEDFADVVEKIALYLADILAFHISLSCMKYFRHEYSQTIWLQPDDPLNVLEELQWYLEQIFPQCQEQGDKSTWGFVPHLTIGQIPIEEDVLGTIQNWQQEWDEQNFVVEEICLISRSGNQPFEIKHRIPLACPATSNKKQNVALSLVNEGLATNFDHLPGKPPRLFIVGASYLEKTPSSDLDILVVGENYLSREDFFANMERYLNSKVVEKVRFIKNARVPILKFCIDGLWCDILYTRYPIPFTHPLRLTWEQVSLFEEQDQAALVSYLDSRTLKRHLWGKDQPFQRLLTEVKSWAKKRNLYGQHLGFPGGIAWTILAAWFCQQPLQKHSLASFFTALERWNWEEQFIALDLTRDHYEKSHYESMVILTPYGFANTTRNVTKNNLQILKQEFSSSQETSISPDENTNKVIIDLSNCSEYENHKGQINSILMTFFISLEKINHSYRPFDWNNKKLVIEIEDKNKNELESAIQELVDLLPNFHLEHQTKNYYICEITS